MRPSTILRTVFVLFVALSLSMGDALAGTPFTRALKRGQSYAHRPYYKSYKNTHRLFARR